MGLAAGPHSARVPAASQLVWLAGWAALLLLDGQIDLANQALLLVLAAAVAGRQNGLLLLAMVLLNTVVAGLMAR